MEFKQIKIFGDKKNYQEEIYYFSRLDRIKEYINNICVKETTYKDGEIEYITKLDPEGNALERIVYGYDVNERVIDYIINFYYLKDKNDKYILNCGSKFCYLVIKSKNGNIFSKTFYLNKGCICGKLDYKNEYNEKGQLVKKTEYGYEDGYHITEWDTQGNKKIFVKRR